MASAVPSDRGGRTGRRPGGEPADRGDPRLDHGRRHRRLHGELFLLHPGRLDAAHTGLVVGYLGAIGNLFVAGFQPFAGNVKDLTGSYTLVFAIVGLAPVIGLATFLWGWDERKRID